MSIPIKYNDLELAYPDMLQGIGMLLQKATLAGRFDSVTLSEVEIEQLQKAKELCELKIVALWEEREQSEFKGLCSTYFDIASLLPIQWDSELLVYEQLKIVAFGCLGEHWHFVKQYLKNHSTQFEAISVSDNWNHRILTNSLKAIVHLVKKENWQDFGQSVAWIDQLRQEQQDFENTFLNQANEEGRPYVAAELVSLYHFAKSVELLGKYLMAGRPLEPENELQYHTRIALEYAQKSGNICLGLLYQFYGAFAVKMVINKYNKIIKIPGKFDRDTKDSCPNTKRTGEFHKLSNNLLQGINTIIISPRRWGKSSLVEKVINTINAKQTKIKTVVIDLFSVSSEEEFLELFAKEVIKASSTKWQDWLMAGRDLFKQIIPKLSVGVDPTSDFSLSFDWEELKKHKDEILNLPETIAQKKNIRFVVCLDEFQNLATFPDYEGLEKKMRAIWQRQKKVCYCLYGSKRHMMTEIFNDTSKPFYRFGDIILLQKISEEDWYHFIRESFENSGKTISEEMARKIPQLMKNHSWYVQQLAHYTWQKTDKHAKMEEVAEALIELINANSPLYQKEVESISGTQLNLLKAISKGVRQLTGAKTMQVYKLGTSRNVLKNKDTLIKEDIVHETSDGFEFLDPAFELWFKKTYFNQEYLDLLHP